MTATGTVRIKKTDGPKDGVGSFVLRVQRHTVPVPEGSGQTGWLAGWLGTANTAAECCAPRAGH